MIDTTINVGHVLTIGSIAIAGYGAFVAMRVTILSLGKRMDGIELDMKQMASAVTKIAVQDERANALDQRLNLQGQRVDDLGAAVARMSDARFDQLIDKFNQMSVRGGR